MLNRKGFGLIELIAVMAIMSIIVLFAIPNFAPYTNYSKENKIKQEISAIEYELKKELIKENMSEWKITTEAEGLELWTAKGKVIGTSGKYFEVPNEKVDTELQEGKFYIKNGKLFYSKVGLNSTLPESSENPGIPENDNDNNNDNNNNNGEIQEVNKIKLIKLINAARNIDKEKYSAGLFALERTLESAMLVNLDNFADQAKINRVAAKLEKALNQLEEKEIISAPNWQMATDNDFVWIKDDNGYNAKNKTGKGVFKYIGNKEYIIIPNIIQGHNMTSYRKMFVDNNIVKGASSSNPKITSTIYMFYNANLAELNLANLNVSNVVYFTGMFNNATIRNHVDLSTWNTSNAVYMEDMFHNASLGTVDVSSFDIRKVTYMYNMFRKAKVDKLDISNFELNKVQYIGYMFTESIINKIFVKNESIKNKAINEGNASPEFIFVK